MLEDFQKQVQTSNCMWNVFSELLVYFPQSSSLNLILVIFDFSQVSKKPQLVLEKDNYEMFNWHLGTCVSKQS
jgi:hypothetical protein